VLIEAPQPAVAAAIPVPMIVNSACLRVNSELMSTPLRLHPLSALDGLEDIGGLLNGHVLEDTNHVLPSRDA
jgi:hypothetical protein